MPMATTLNLSYIGFDDSRGAGDHFYVKDPADANDFDWAALTDYHDYTTVSHQEDTSVTLNDFDAWPELDNLPNKLPTLAEVKNWPATFIRWYGAKAFAQYHNLDLPTEAQWEYALRGGQDFVYGTADGNVNGDGTSANWNHLSANPSLGHVLDVKLNAANPFGLYNLAGNVWEWMEDWYEAAFYSTSAATEEDPVSTADTGFKVRRGGSWNYHQATLKSASRTKDESFKGNDHFGFRVVDNNITRGTIPPFIISQPEASPSPDSDLTWIIGIEADGTSPLKYQWFRNGEEISGNDSPTLQVPKIASGDTASFHAIITNEAGAVSSDILLLSGSEISPIEIAASQGDNPLELVLTFSGNEGIWSLESSPDLKTWEELQTIDLSQKSVWLIDLSQESTSVFFRTVYRKN